MKGLHVLVSCYIITKSYSLRSKKKISMIRPRLKVLTGMVDMVTILTH